MPEPPAAACMGACSLLQGSRVNVAALSPESYRIMGLHGLGRSNQHVVGRILVQYRSHHHPLHQLSRWHQANPPINKDPQDLVNDFKKLVCSALLTPVVRTPAPRRRAKLPTIDDGLPRRRGAIGCPIRWSRPKMSYAQVEHHLGEEVTRCNLQCNLQFVTGINSSQGNPGTLHGTLPSAHGRHAGRSPDGLRSMLGRFFVVNGSQSHLGFEHPWS
jgi:hypothetical protein